MTTYIGTIGIYSFEYNDGDDRINVYSAGDSPVAHILISSPISEKDFHYEIMSWYSQAS